MPKKRTFTESNNEEQTDEGSESPTQTEDDAKRAKLDPEWGTTLHDLPIELLEFILVKTVVMEAKGLKLAKSVWKEKADLLISRLTSVCWLWRNILTTNSFRTKLHRILDSTAQTIRLEILHESAIPSESLAVTTLGDELFLLYGRLNEHYAINVYSRENMTQVKKVIALPGTDAEYMTGCNASNCIYICLRERYCRPFSVFRISRDAEHKFNVSQWINDGRLFIIAMNVSANGILAVLSFCVERYRVTHAINVYDADGRPTLQREIVLLADNNVFLYQSIVQKLNGNIVLAYVGHRDFQQGLLEFDTRSGKVVRQFESSYEPTRESSVHLADDNDRLMIVRSLEGIELLDFELNLLGVCGLQKNQSKPLAFADLHYDCNRNEIACIYYDESTHRHVLSILRFTEE